MSELRTQVNLEQLQSSPEMVAEKQLALAKEWADIYGAAEDAVQVRSAEIVLRNPAAYSEQVNFAKLPEETQAKWEGLIDFSNLIAEKANRKHTEWTTANGLTKIHDLVFRGDVNPNYRGSISDIMRQAAELFSDSSKHIPYDTKYYAGNVWGAMSWLRNHKERS